MRYYEISITNPEDGSFVTIGDSVMYFTSFVYGKTGGVTNPGALNIEFDMPIYTMDIQAGSVYLKILGIDLNVVNKAGNLNFKNITIKGGMKKGLPLATEQANKLPERNGILFTGTIFQAMGNWQGIDQSLDLYIIQNINQKTPTVQDPPIVLECKGGSLLSDAITNALSPSGITPKIAISSKLVPANGIAFHATDINDFSRQLRQHSRNILNDQTYQGVMTYKTELGYSCTDNTIAATDKIQVNFNDLIGQPTWKDFSTLQLRCVLRSDIKVGDTVKMPDEYNSIALAPKVSTQYKNKIAFTGDAFVSAIRHIGNYRQPDANAWATVLDVWPNTANTQ